ncbi:hypothetical protein [Clostridium sp. OS1-26]|uniref:hypothetical protein n=1 Tax=Clostridium sp. OS1-26 TaxID=3070681 RepID=UPI0027DFD5CE|nr:hypothetical protein [Clostridium sp. OS1-26]WML34310.1 hypothetical protein RCG18_23930 [Clostridium sp. OS1-26]
MQMYWGVPIEKEYLLKNLSSTLEFAENLDKYFAADVTDVVPNKYIVTEINDYHALEVTDPIKRVSHGCTCVYVDSVGSRSCSCRMNLLCFREI